MSVLLRGGLVLTDDELVASDVLIEGSRVAAVDTDITTRVDREVDASGCLVGPGLVDLHTHLRDPGQTWKEDLSSGLRAATAGGFTALVAMPNTDPPPDNAMAVSEMGVRASDTGPVEVSVAGTLTVGRRGLEPAPVEAMYEAGARIFTDDGDCLEDSDMAKELMRRIAGLPGAVFVQHAEMTSLTSDGHMHAGRVSALLGVGGLPSEAESAIVARDIDLVRRTGVAYHCQHVSAAETVDLIRTAREEGLQVTAEVAPHHLSFTEGDVADLNPNLKMYPPLRTDEDRSALRSALLDGTIDAVATDHAPHTEDEKAAGFTAAPRGVIGLETAAAAVWEVVGDPHMFFRVLSANPALIAGMPGQGQPIRAGELANLVVFDPKARWTPESFFSKSANSPYLGIEMKGRVVATIAKGQLEHDIGQVPA